MLMETRVASPPVPADPIEALPDTKKLKTFACK